MLFSSRLPRSSLAAIESFLDERKEDPILVVRSVEESAHVTLGTQDGAGEANRRVSRIYGQRRSSKDQAYVVPPASIQLRTGSTANKNKVCAARSRLSSKRIRKDTETRRSEDGVSGRGVNPGQVVSAEQELFTVTDLSTVWAIGDLSEKDSPRGLATSAVVPLHHWQGESKRRAAVLVVLRPELAAVGLY